MIFSCKSREKSFPFFGSKINTEKIIEGDQLVIRANNEKNKGNFEQAMRLYEASLKRGGNHAAAHYELAQMRYELENNYTSALFHINQALELDSKNKWYIFFFLKINEENGKYQLVEEGYQKLLTLFPNKVEHHVEFADYFISQKKYVQALELYNIVESKIGISEPVNKNKYLIYKGLKQEEKAIGELKKLIKTYPTKERYYMDLVDMYRSQNRDSVINNTYQLALKNVIPNTAILDEYAHYKFLKNQKDTAFILHKQILLTPNYSIKYKLEIINFYQKMGKRDSSIIDNGLELIDTLVNTHPKNFHVNKYLGEVNFRKKEYRLSRSFFETAVKSRKNSYNVWQQLVMADHQLKDWSSMTTHAEEGISYFPTQSQLYYYLALSFERQNKTKRCIEVYEQGLELCTSLNQKVTFLSALGDAYNTIKEYAKSDESFEEILQEDSLNTLILNNYAYYLSVRNTNLQKAEEMSNLSNVLAPGNASYNDTYGWILYQNSQYDEAAKWLLKAENNGGGDSAIILEHIGDTYQKLNNKVIAKEYYLKAIEKEGDKTNLQLKINSL